MKKTNFNRSEDQQHFGLRKLSIGVASVLLGTTFMVYGGRTVEAASTTANTDANHDPENGSTETDDNGQLTVEKAPTILKVKADQADSKQDQAATKKEETAKPVASTAVATDKKQADSEEKAASTQTLDVAKAFKKNDVAKNAKASLKEEKATDTPDADKLLKELQVNTTDISDAQLQALGLKRDEFLVDGVKYHIDAKAYFTDLDGKKTYIGQYKIHDENGGYVNINASDDLLLENNITDIYQITTLIPVIQGNTIYVHVGTDLNTVDASKAFAPEDWAGATSYTWDTKNSNYIVDTSKVGTYPGMIDIVWGNKRSTAAGLTVVVIGPDGKDEIKVNQNDPVPSASTVITNTNEIEDKFPGTTYTWKTTPDTSKPGTYPATVVVNWPDHTTTEVNTKIVVDQTIQTKDETKEVTRTIVDNVPGEKPVTTEQKVTFSRTVTEDMQGKFISATDWKVNGQPVWHTYEAKGAKGYTPTIASVDAQVVNADTKDVTVNIEYNANDLTQKVNYVSSDRHEIISTQLVPGKVNSSTSFKPEVPENWVIAEGQNIPSEIKFGTDTPAPITIYIKHGTQNVTDKTEKTVTRQVSYINPSTSATVPVATQKATLHRTGTKDLVTGQVTYTPWTTAHFDAVKAPEIEGYTVQNPNDAPAMDVNGDTQDSVVIFNYASNEQKQEIHFVNGEDKTTVVKKYDITGKTHTIANTNIESNIPAGWVLVPGQSIPTRITFGTKEAAPIVVYVQHGTKNVTDGTEKTVTRTVNYIDPATGKTVDVAKQTATLHRTATQDLVTGKVTYGNWNTTHFETVSAPVLPGYYVSGNAVAPYMEVNGDTQDSVVTFHYAAKWHNQGINYVDKDNRNNVLKTDYIPGLTGATVTYTAKAPEGWVIVPGQSIPTSFTFGSDDPKTITILVQHGTQNVTDGTEKTVTRTVEIINPVSGATETVASQKVTLHRSATQDLVTGQVTYGAWQTSHFDAVKAPNFPGYTVVNPDDAPAMDVTGDTNSSTVIFHYNANEQKQEIRFVDGTDKTTVVDKYDVTGKTNTTVNTNVQNHVPANWVLVPGQSIPSTITFGSKESAPIIVYVQHGTKNVTDGTEKTITRTVNYADPVTGETKPVATQTATIHRTATQDLVTGKVTYGAWQTSHFDAVKAPNLPGYEVLNPNDAPAMEVNGDTKSSTVVFRYNANEQKQEIRFVDGSDKTTVVDKYNVTGKTNTTVNADVQSHVPANWVIVPGQSIPSTITFGSKESAPIIVYVQHGSKNVTDGTEKVVTRTVEAINPVSGATETVATQTATLHRTATQDTVTGKVTYGAWQTTKFTAVKAPEFAGYTVVNPNDAPEIEVNGDTKDTTVIFRYNANEQKQEIRFVDGSNKTTVVDKYNVTGKTNTTVNADVQNHVPANWVLVPGQSIPSTITFGSKESAPIIVYVQHGTKNITDGTEKTITRTVNYADPVTGNINSVATQTATIHRTATQDLVTGKVTYGKWQTEHFDAVKAPNLPGYAVLNPNDAPAMEVNGDTKDTTVVFRYNANKQSVTINYVDADNQSNIVKTDSVNGKTGATVAYNAKAPEGWVIVPGQSVPTSFTFGSQAMGPVKILVRQLQSYKYNATTKNAFTTHVGANAQSPSLNASSAQFNWTDKQGNAVTAPTGYSVAWKNVPSTTTATDKEMGTLVITFSDGSSIDVQAPVVVKAATAINGVKVNQNDPVPAASGSVDISNIKQFDFTNVTWVKAPSTAVPGAAIPGTARVHYADGTYQDVDVTIDVRGVENGKDHQKDRAIYREIGRTYQEVNRFGQLQTIIEDKVYARTRITDYAYPEGDARRVTYTNWELIKDDKVVQD